jgi:hypothetical protein
MLKLNHLIASVTIAAGVAVAAPPCSAAALVTVRPPAVRVEVRPAAPGPGYVWVAGHWKWNAKRHVWVSGRWIRKPYPTSIWVAGHWKRQGRGWVWVSGRWR